MTIQTPNQQYHTNISKQTVLESRNNCGLTKMSMNVSSGRNSSSKYRNQSDDNVNRTMKKFNRIESIQENNEIQSPFVIQISELIEESLKQVDNYRSKIQNSLTEEISTKTFNDLKDNHSLKFPQRPTIPIELIGKLNSNNFQHLITNSNPKKLDEANTLIGRYEISNSMNPINNLFHSNEQIKKLNINISFESFEEYFNRLLNQYFHDQNFDQNFKSKMNSLSLAEQIKDFFKQIYQRYRIIVQVFLEEHLDQSILIASRSLWNQFSDHFLQYSFFKKKIFIFIIVFFIYKE